MDNLKCKTQAHARMYEENKLEEKNDAYWYNVAEKGASLKDQIEEEDWCIKMVLSRMIHHSIKVLVQYQVKH